MFIRLSIVIATAIGVALIIVAPCSKSLSKVHAGIEKAYENVSHIESRTLRQMESNDVVIFDVREFDEYQVSHIKGAIQLDPDMDSEDFEDEYSELIEDKVVVFYCSVGVRSSAQASSLEYVLNDAKVAAAYNLKGGLFQWHNESHPVVKDTDTSTEDIHPYDDDWGKLIENEQSIRYF